MSLFLGIDTSNYTTSAAVYDTETGRVVHAKKLLPVKQGERGIRQSDAVFYHTRQFPEIYEELCGQLPKDWKPDAVGVSTQPRRVEGSYMPCFLVGETIASSIAGTMHVPLYKFSHQEGHIMAALYSAERMDLIGQEFLAFHVSGGTTESLLVTKGTEAAIKAELLGSSTDLKAGQAIDRTGVMMGLPFPCGPALEKLALKSDKTFKLHASSRGFDCSLSGVENQTRAMIERGESPEDTALFCLKYVEISLQAMADALLDKYPEKHIVFSGGVMSNGIIKEDFKRRYDCSFAEPQFSADNAAGTAVLAALQHERKA